MWPAMGPVIARGVFSYSASARGAWFQFQTFSPPKKLGSGHECRFKPGMSSPLITQQPMKNIKLLTAWPGSPGWLRLHRLRRHERRRCRDRTFSRSLTPQAPGDTLVVQPGIYPDASLVFNKPLTVLPSGTNGEMMQLFGTVQVPGRARASFQRAYFAAACKPRRHGQLRWQLFQRAHCRLRARRPASL